VRLQEEARSHLFAGEGAFYDYLKPYFIKRFEKVVGSQARRQGDIFALRVADRCEFPSLNRYRMILMGSELEIKKGKEITLFGTRHVFTGEYCVLAYTPSVVLGCGVVEAPDHEKMDLESIYFLHQSQALYSPSQAD
jgi:hypothetical protein